MSIKNKTKKPGAEITTEAVSVNEDHNRESTAEVKPVIEMPAVKISVDHIRSSYTEPEEDPRLVKVIVEYPENYKDKKYLKDKQEYKVSPETADRFEKLGIAKRIDG